MVAGHDHNDCWRGCKLCCLCICPCSSCYSSWRIKYYCQCCFGSLYLEGEVTQAWYFGLRDVHCRFCHNCDPCTTGACYYFCSGNMEYGNPTSISALCGLCNCIGFHFGLPFCTTMRAHRRVSFHGHLFFDGFSLVVQVMSVKALGTSLKLTFEGNNQLIFSETWFFLLVVATCVITQMNYLNKALDTFNTAIVSPIYYVMFTTLTILASVIMFKDWDGQSGGTIMTEICGFIVVLSGTILLHSTKDFERSSSFRGSYAPVSPSLSTRLCSGNGELLKFNEEDAPPSEDI
ncbi:uncharacterized protein LOC133878385 isoform X2 [Alnus glutinosa]|uniref:uncharacterized protein LOC133878385 isoform X2 n=1 Tax=Alnus glutinosa TaxID=3517 RepID=UPI002D772487|nr:uncharacterized protein LOC133878385 isoform X2 [Alnus glutinosa]